MARPYRRSKKHSSKKSYSSKRQKFGECSYHLCPKRNVRLYRCKHCREYYCHEHLYAKIPQIAPFKSIDVDRHIEWGKKGGHPCLPYFDFILEKEKNQPQIIIPKKITVKNKRKMIIKEKPLRVPEIIQVFLPCHLAFLALLFQKQFFHQDIYLIFDSSHNFDIILPGIKIDPEPLYKEAEKIEKNIRKFMEQSKPTAPSSSPVPFQMYG